MTTASEADAKPLPQQVFPPKRGAFAAEEEAEWTRLLVANRKIAGRVCSADYLDGLIDLAEHQASQRPTYRCGFSTLVRVMQHRLRRMAAS